MAAYTVYHYKGMKIFHYPKSAPLTRPGWYVKGFFRCPTLKAAKEFIDNYDEHLDTFCEAAKRVLKGR
jgi:hypothetical protein